jgi:hypothetical protein
VAGTPLYIYEKKNFLFLIYIFCPRSIFALDQSTDAPNPTRTRFSARTSGKSVVRTQLRAAYHHCSSTANNSNSAGPSMCRTSRNHYQSVYNNCLRYKFDFCPHCLYLQIGIFFVCLLIYKFL